jgi:hypothetical protein
MPWTDVQIANLALLKLGEEVVRVTSITGADTSKYGLALTQIYELTRQEELRSFKWQFAIQRIQVQQAQVTTSAIWNANSAVMQVGTTAGMVAGWLVSSVLIQGGGQVSFPPGIPTGTTISAIIDGTHIQMSNPATVGGQGVLVFQVNNLTGYWFAYVVPPNLRGVDIYAVFPNYTFVWPFKIQNIVEFGFINERGYIYTNLDPGNGNPIFQMLTDPGAAAYPPDFVEALSVRLAMKLCRPATKDEAIMNNLTKEYAAILLRAQGNNQSEGSNEEMGNPWWVEDRRGGRG